MNVYTTYNFSINGTDEEIQAIGRLLKSKINDVEYDIGNEIYINEVQISVDDEDVVDLVKTFAKDVANVAGNAVVTIDGLIDTSENAGELMNFKIKYKDGKLTARFSDWYIETAMESYEDYEDFNDNFFECTEEEYNAVKDKEFVYILEEDDDEILSVNVPLGDAEVIEL